MASPAWSVVPGSFKLIQTRDAEALLCIMYIPTPSLAPTLVLVLTPQGAEMGRKVLHFFLLVVFSESVQRGTRQASLLAQEKAATGDGGTAAAPV